jgi:hypothetical protein
MTHFRNFNIPYHHHHAKHELENFFLYTTNSSKQGLFSLLLMSVCALRCFFFVADDG